MDPIKYSKALKAVSSKGKALKYEAWENHDQHEFLDKINADPKDPFAHQIYADWLGDQGKQTHSELIQRAVNGEEKTEYGQPKGDTWDTSNDPWAQGDFGVAAWQDRWSKKWAVDLASMHMKPLPSGNFNRRHIWTLKDLHPEEAGRLYHGLLREGAAGATEGLNVPPKPVESL